MGRDVGLTAAGRLLVVVGTGLWAQCFALEVSIAPQALHGEIRHFLVFPGKAQAFEKLNVAKLHLQTPAISARLGFLLCDAEGQSSLGKTKFSPYSLPDTKKAKETSSWVPVSA